VIQFRDLGNSISVFRALFCFQRASMGAPEVVAVDSNTATAAVPQMSYAEFQRWKQQKVWQCAPKFSWSLRFQGLDRLDYFSVDFQPSCKNGDTDLSVNF